MATNRQKKPANDEASLFNEMKRLAKRANQRILRLERLTGQTGTFATKQLYDYLDSENLQAVTPKGRVAVRKSFSKTQMESIIKALKQFNEGVSTVARAKKERALLSKQAGIELSFAQVNTYFQSKNYENLIKKYFESDFWYIAREVVKNGYSYNRFVDILKGAIEAQFTDELLRENLQGLYDYIQGDNY